MLSSLASDTIVRYVYILANDASVWENKKKMWETPRANHNIVTSRRYISLYLLYIIVNGYIQRGTS